MMHRRFHWDTKNVAGDGGICCEYGPIFILWAQPDGQWRVNVRRAENQPALILITHENQRRGADLQEAQRMAQAAAMALTFA